MEPEVVTQKFVQQFPGLMTDVDEGDIPWGAATVQTNMQSLVPGKLNTRRGWGRSSDYMSATPTANDLISIYSYPRPDGDYCVTADAGGAVKARRGGAATTIASSRTTCGTAPRIQGDHEFQRSLIWSP